MASLPNKPFLGLGAKKFYFFQLASYRWQNIAEFLYEMACICVLCSSTHIALSKMGPHVGPDVGLKAIILLLSHSILNFLYLLVVFYYKIIVYHLYTSYVRY